jgi:integrase
MTAEKIGSHGGGTTKMKELYGVGEKWLNRMTAVINRKKIDDMSRRLAQVHSKYTVLWVIGCDTGLRVSDILNIRANIPANGCFSVREKKTKKTRQIQLSEETKRLIEKHVKRYRLEKREYLVFSRDWARNSPLSRSQAYRVLRRTGEEIGIREIGTHGMRKTFAAALYARTKDIFEVQRTLNHKYVTTTILYLTGDLNALNFMPKVPAGD